MNQMIQKMVPPYLLARLGMTLRVSFIVSLLLLAQWTSLAATIIVANPQDGVAANTLRGAVAAANQRGGNTTIKLTGNAYGLTASELAVKRGNLTIVGLNKSSTIRSGSGRIFHVYPGATLTLQNLVLTGGKKVDVGGAVKNEGTLNLQSCVLRGNTASSGAAIFNSGSLSMSNDGVWGNACTQGQGGSGGGVYNSGQLTASDCIISNNVSGTGAVGGTPDYNTHWGGIGVVSVMPPPDNYYAGGDAGGGGGIFNAGNMTLNGCFVMNNATGNGGNARVEGNDGGSGGSGGGVFNAGSLALSQCVIGGNRCGMGGSGMNRGPGGSGDGMCNAPGATVQVFNCLVSLNLSDLAATESGPDLAGTFVSEGYNLISVGDGSTGFTNNVMNDIVGTVAEPADPRLYQVVTPH